MAGRPKKLTEKNVIEALEKAHGLKSLAAAALNVAYNTLAAYIKDSEAAQEVIAANRERRFDTAEYKLDEAIARGENWAVSLALKDSRFGRERGYGNSLEVNANIKMTWEEFVEQAKNGNSGAGDK